MWISRKVSKNQAMQLAGSSPVINLNIIFGVFPEPKFIEKVEFDQIIIIITIVCACVGRNIACILDFVGLLLVNTLHWILSPPAPNCLSRLKTLRKEPIPKMPWYGRSTPFPSLKTWVRSRM